MRVVVLYNEASEDASVDERDILAQRDAVTAALRQLGHTATPLSCTLDLSATRSQLEELSPDAVFNLVESLGGTDRLMPAATLLLEALNLPYTGNPTRSILATSNKLGAKDALRQAGLPTPDWTREGEGARPATSSAESGRVGEEDRRGDAETRRRGESQLPLARKELPSPPGRGAGGEGERAEGDISGADQALSSSSPRLRVATSPPRVIVKAVWEHASFHMDDDAVVSLAPGTSLDDILRARDELTGRPHFAEAFIDGREFNLTLLAGPGGPQVLPPAEIDFAAYPIEKPKIVGYRAKWDADSFEHENTPRRFDFKSHDRSLLDRLSELAVQCWHLFELRGYARVDFRVDADNQPWILEVNANPCLAPDAGFAAAVERAGLGYHEAIGRIVDDANGSICSPDKLSPIAQGRAAAQ